MKRHLKLSSLDNRSWRGRKGLKEDGPITVAEKRVGTERKEERFTSRGYELESESMQVNIEALNVELSQWVESRLGK